jgi:UDP-glucose 4-epimerase
MGTRGGRSVALKGPSLKSVYSCPVTRIAVIGGAGFVGTNLVRALMAQGDEVLVIDDFSTGLISNVEHLPCEISRTSIYDQIEIEKALSGCDFIFHLAARGSVPRSIKNPDATFNVNVVGTLNVVRYAQMTKTPLVFSSSSSVYGSNLELPKNEFMWTSPMTPYAASKLCGESLVESYSRSFGFQAFTFRFFNIFGPWQRPDHDYAAVIPKWIWKAMNKQVLEIYGDGEHTRDFTYIDSVISALLQVKKRNLASPHPVNLAFGARISLNSLASELSTYFPDLRVEYRDPRAGDVKDSQNDPTHLNNVLPGIEVTSFEDGLKKTIEWFEEFGEKITGAPTSKD